jgi:hypothetical protein
VVEVRPGAGAFTFPPGCDCDITNHVEVNS